MFAVRVLRSRIFENLVRLLRIGNAGSGRPPANTLLHWRLILGFLLIALLVGLAYADFYAPRPGLYLAPLGLAGVLFGSAEMVRLFENNAPLTKAEADALPAQNDTAESARLSPNRRVVVTGAAMTMLVSMTPLLWKEYPADCPVGRVGWIGIGLAMSLLIAFVVEMIRYRRPGVATVRLSQTMLGIIYCGGLMGFLVQLRILSGEPWGTDGRWGMLALLSLVAVVKANDTGAYTAGRLLGKTKLVPILSPGKTWEGALGGLLLAITAAMLMLGPLAGAMGCDAEQSLLRWGIGCVVYGIVVGVAGIAGDLAISLLKRDAGLKNSSTWMPGFGGVLDLLDSILFAAPVAYLLWIARIVGP